ncbi:MAG: response regulator transcription factor [Gomphosphaeria aponina SAG 52.96 = DSM 107014]|uniref:Response regulator transcription factor n=1 Tax=Gomphosphaeria aponina SAG 52.96 = DSM 107014 TaxID=1521640 RepID=A0A941GTY7_9CHRO|nr:response regulator transcription factor [Gomphosphaeria aponina SAG 52.96 = DSM 107014]
MLVTDAPQTSYQTAPFTPTTRILVVEDEELIQEMIVTALKEEDYEVIYTSDGQEALNILQSTESPDSEFPLDLIILDLLIPKVKGLDLCRLLRNQGSMVPILILSCLSSEADRVIGLEVGADDYLTKPFSMKELLARCRAILRRQSYMNPPTAIKQFRDITLYPKECRVIVRGQAIKLSPKELRLLELFMSYPRRVWSREQLIEHVWGAEFMGDTKTVDVHIRWLREKLERDAKYPKYLITVRGFGYRLG